jgi:CRP/FNR family transcriptional regulator, cyclic AMP receptor protein
MPDDAVSSEMSAMPFGPGFSKVARSETIGLLAKQEILQGLGEDDLGAIAGVCRQRRWPAGAILFQRGDEGREMILINGGRVRISVLSSEGRELALRHAGPATLIGEIAALHGGERTADATAVTDVRALTIPAGDLRRILAERPAISAAIIQFLCERIRLTTEQLETIALHGLEARLARFLLGQMNRVDVVRATEGKNGEAVSLTLALTQGEIAELIGASRARVNMAFSRLEQTQAIHRRSGRMLCNVRKLSNCAGGCV